MALKLTKRAIDALTSDDPKGRRFYDSQLVGFFVTVYPDGRKVFGARYGGRKGRRRVTLGTYGPLTVDGAREAASRTLAQARLAAIGQAPDPATTRNRRRECPTWGGWTAIYVERVKLEKKSGAQDERYLGLSETSGTPFRAFRHRLSSRLLADLVADDFLRFRDTLKGTPIQANRWVAAVRGCLSAAVKAGFLSANPARDIPKFREGTPRQRVLSAQETTALLAAIDAEEDPHARAGLLLLASTGARLSEALHARWEDISGLDGDRPVWTIPSPKAGKPQAVPLPENAAQVLRRLPRLGPYIVAGRKSLAPRRDLKGPWGRALERAGLGGSGLVVHDLRRSHGLEIYRSSGLLAAQRILRHADARTTERVYAPISAEELREAQERRSRTLKFRAKRAG